MGAWWRLGRCGFSVCAEGDELGRVAALSSPSMPWLLTRWAGGCGVQRLAGWPATPATPIWLCSLRRWWQVASSSHSPRAWSSPPSKSCLAFCGVCIWPKTGSTIAFAAGVNLTALVGRELASHALFSGGIVGDTPTWGDWRRVAAAVASGGDIELGAVLGGGEVVSRAVAGVGFFSSFLVFWSMVPLAMTIEATPDRHFGQNASHGSHIRRSGGRSRFGIR